MKVIPKGWEMSSIKTEDTAESRQQLLDFISPITPHDNRIALWNSLNERVVTVRYGDRVVKENFLNRTKFYIMPEELYQELFTEISPENEDDK